jgi:hypothetical protein
MPIQVLIEPVAKNGYRATSGAPLALSVEAPTRAQALAKLKLRLGKRLRNGAELVSLELAAVPEENPWVKFAGMFRDNPMFDEVLEIMATNRRKDDADPDAP